MPDAGMHRIGSRHGPLLAPPQVKTTIATLNRRPFDFATILFDISPFLQPVWVSQEGQGDS
jgi:hypothetical protein